MTEEGPPKDVFHSFRRTWGDDYATVDIHPFGFVFVNLHGARPIEGSIKLALRALEEVSDIVASGGLNDS